jgi:hypothetical protein
MYVVNNLFAVQTAMQKDWAGSSVLGQQHGIVLQRCTRDPCRTPRVGERQVSLCSVAAGTQERQCRGCAGQHRMGLQNSWNIMGLHYSCDMLRLSRVYGFARVI